MRPRAQVHIRLGPYIRFDLSTRRPSKCAGVATHLTRPLQLLELHLHLPVFFHHVFTGVWPIHTVCKAIFRQHKYKGSPFIVLERFGRVLCSIETTDCNNKTRWPWAQSKTCVWHFIRTHLTLPWELQATFIIFDVVFKQGITGFYYNPHKFNRQHDEWEKTLVKR